MSSKKRDLGRELNWVNQKLDEQTSPVAIPLALPPAPNRKKSSTYFKIDALIVILVLLAGVVFVVNNDAVLLHHENEGWIAQVFQAGNVLTGASIIDSNNIGITGQGNANATSCGLVNAGTLNLMQSVTSNGTCFTLNTTSSTTINCQGFTVNYSVAGVLGYGVNVTATSGTAEDAG